MMPSFALDTHTESAGTAITEIIPPLSGHIPRITGLEYICAGTAHTLTIMRCVGSTVTAIKSAGGVSTLELETDQPGLTTAKVEETLATSDWLAWVDENDTYKFDEILTVSGNVMTMTNSLGTDVSKGAKVFAFYEVGRATNLVFTMPINTTTKLEGIFQGGFSRQRGVQTSRAGDGEPLAIHINNASAAGTLTWATGNYTPASNIVLG